MKQIFIIKENKKGLKSPDDVFKNIKKFEIDYEQENFIIFYLNNRNHIIGSDILFKGGVDSCVIDPKIIFRYALKNKATKIILGHNHPSGYLEPSEEDLKINKILKECGEILILKLMDNIIFNKKEYYSYIGESD